MKEQGAAHQPGAMKEHGAAHEHAATNRSTQPRMSPVQERAKKLQCTRILRPLREPMFPGESADTSTSARQQRIEERRKDDRAMPRGGKDIYYSLVPRRLRQVELGRCRQAASKMRRRGRRSRYLGGSRSSSQHANFRAQPRPQQVRGYLQPELSDSGTNSGRVAIRNRFRSYHPDGLWWLVRSHYPQATLIVAWSSSSSKIG